MFASSSYLNHVENMYEYKIVFKCLALRRLPK